MKGHFMWHFDHPGSFFKLKNWLIPYYFSLRQKVCIYTKQKYPKLIWQSFFSIRHQLNKLQWKKRGARHYGVHQRWKKGWSAGAALADSFRLLQTIFHPKFLFFFIFIYFFLTSRFLKIFCNTLKFSASKGFLSYNEILQTGITHS